MTEAEEGMPKRFANKEFIMYAGKFIRPREVSKIASVVYLLNMESNILLADVKSGLFSHGVSLETQKIPRI